MSIVSQNFWLFPDVSFLRNAFFLHKPTKHLVFLACVGISLPVSSLISRPLPGKTYYPANFPSLRRSFSSQFLFYSLSSLSKDLLYCQFPLPAQVFLLQYSLLPPAIPLERPTILPIPPPCVGLSLPIFSFTSCYPSRKTYYIANSTSLRRSFSTNILFYHFAFSSTDLLIYIITIIVQAFPKYYLMPMIILTLPS